MGFDFIEPTDMEEEQLLRCPVCDFSYTHLSSIAAFERPAGEDAETMGVLINGGDVTIKHGVDNPSTRRDAVELRFWSECGSKFRIQYIQHKGETFTATHVETSCEGVESTD